MKKIITLLLVAVIAFTSFATTALAAEPAFFKMSADTTAVDLEQNIVVTIGNNNAWISSFAAYVQYDPEALELVSLVNAKGESYDYQNPITFAKATFPIYLADDNKINASIAPGAAGNTIAIGGNYNGESMLANETTKLAVATFKAKTAGATSLYLKEGWDFKYPDAYPEVGGQQVVQAADTLVQTIEITVTDPNAGGDDEPEKDETITGDDEDGTPVEADKTKTWTVTVGKDLVGQALKATLTNSAAADDNKTQEVNLTFADDVQGGVSLIFNVEVKFIDFANAATTTLKIEKAAN